jgi:hypothetical protein
MSSNVQRNDRHRGSRTAGRRDPGKRVEDLLNHESLKYTFVTRQMRGI